VPRPDQKLDVSEVTFATLAKLRDRPKYVKLPGTLYNGLRPEPARLQAERQMNALIDRLREGLPSNPSKKFALREFAKTMAEFDPIDLHLPYQAAGSGRPIVCKPSAPN
jgi:Domain of unknown function (DUF4844)